MTVTSGAVRILGALTLATLAAADTTTVINAKSDRGTWEGWGTSLAWWAKRFGDRDDLANLFFTLNTTTINGNALPGLGLNIARYNAGASSYNTYNGTKMVASPNIKSSRQIDAFWVDWASADPASSSWNWNVDANQRNMLSKAKARGANRLELFSNSPVWWMCKNHNPSGASDGSENIQSWNLQQHAIYLANIAQRAKNSWGITFESVDAMNEPIANWWKADGTQEGCHINVATQASIINYLRTELNNRGLSSTIVSASDESYYDQAVSTFNGLGSALNNVGRINVHGYQGSSGRRDSLYSLAHGRGLKLWNSEFGDGDATGKGLVSNLLLDLRWLQPTAWVYWQVLDGGGWGLLDANNDNGSINGATQKLFLLAQYTRHIRQGMRILDGGDGNTVAAYDSANRKLVIVSVNWGSGQYLNFDLSGFSQRPASGTVIPRWKSGIGSGDRYKSYPSDTTISTSSFWSYYETNTVQTFEISNIAP